MASEDVRMCNADWRKKLHELSIIEEVFIVPCCLVCARQFFLRLGHASLSSARELRPPRINRMLNQR